MRADSLRGSIFARPVLWPRAAPRAIMKKLFSNLRGKLKGEEIQAAESKRGAQPPQTAAERRVVKRHQANIPAKMGYGFSGMSEPSQVKDINERGLFFYSVLPLAHGSTVEVEMTLPPELTHGNKRRVRYIASVVRVEEKAGGELFGIAAAIKRCEVLPEDASKKEAAKAAKSSR